MSRRLGYSNGKPAQSAEPTASEGQSIRNVVGKLAKKVDLLQANVNVMASVLAGMSSPAPEDELPELTIQNRVLDYQWMCERCGAQLGIWDRDGDVLRVRDRRMLLNVRCGPEGFVKSWCYVCSFENTLEGAEGAGQQIPPTLQPVSGMTMAVGCI